MSPKKPWMAALLSVLFPGLGYLCLDRPIPALLCARGQHEADPPPRGSVHRG